MTNERAIEILDPEHREHYDSIEPVNEACRIGMNAIKRVAVLERAIKIYQTQYGDVRFFNFDVAIRQAGKEIGNDLS